MTTTHCWIANLQAVDKIIGLLPGKHFVIIYLVINIIQRLKHWLSSPFGGAGGGIKLLHNSLSYGLTAHIHSDETGGKEGTVFITIDLFKNKPQHRGVDECLVVFLYGFPAFTAKVVGVEELK